MADMRWRDEREEKIELLYRILADHGGSLLKSEARELGPWAADVAERAEQLWWLVTEGSPPVLKVTYGGRKALDAALANRDLEPHWFGGSIARVETEYGGPIILPKSYAPYNELKKWAAEQGMLTQEDLDRIAQSPRRENQPGEPENLRMLDELSFPGTRYLATSFVYRDGHPFGGGMLDPAGHEGPYQVTATLTRRGAPGISYAYMTDAYAMGADWHLRLVMPQREDGAVGVPLLLYVLSEDEHIRFQLLPASLAT